MSTPYRILYNKYYVDEIYNALFVAPLLFISRYVLWHVIDEGLIDGIVNGSASLARASGSRLRELQSGNAHAAMPAGLQCSARLASRYSAGCSGGAPLMPAQPLLLTVITFLPLLSVAALLFLRSDDHVWVKRESRWPLRSPSSSFSLFLLRGFDIATAGYQFEEMRIWIGDAIHYHLGLDGISSHFSGAAHHLSLRRWRFCAPGNRSRKT